VEQMLHFFHSGNSSGQTTLDFINSVWTLGVDPSSRLGRSTSGGVNSLEYNWPQVTPICTQKSDFGSSFVEVDLKLTLNAN